LIGGIGRYSEEIKIGSEVPFAILYNQIAKRCGEPNEL